MPMSPSAAFGYADCEAELQTLEHGEFADLFLAATPFSDVATRPETYLIIGRRGSGKTALAQYFRFQSDFPNPIYIQIEEPAVFQDVLSHVVTALPESREVVIFELVQIWTYVLWNVIFDKLRNESAAIAAAVRTPPHNRSDDFVRATLEDLVISLRGTSQRSVREQIGALDDGRFNAARDVVLRIARTHPIILVFDTFERYDTSNDALMSANAALVQCAGTFNRQYSEAGIHLKVFMAGEIFPFPAGTGDPQPA